MYDEIAQYYDWEHEEFEEDVPLYLGFAGASVGGVLDAACGTGRILLPLTKAGYEVTGVDLSAGMLVAARRRLGESGLASKARLVCEDLRTLALRRQYGLALVALGSFHHLSSFADQRASLHRLAMHVRPRGLLVLDLLNPTSGWISAGDGALVHQLTAQFPKSGGRDQLSKFVARTTSFETQIDHQLLLYDLSREDGTLERRVVQMDLRFLFRYEAELLLSEAGFKLRDLFGGYELGPYQSDSPRMIFVAEKR